MSVPFVRPAKSLTTLEGELNQAWPGRGPDLGFITGYKAADNLTGHNPNEKGICMAFDIGIHATGQGISPAAGRDLAEYLRRDANEKFQYLIHDMGTEAEGVRPKIAGNHTGWKWQPYTGSHPHSDHIHISIVDLYWGDDCGVPADVYDSTSTWGVTQYFPSNHGPVSTPPPPHVEVGWVVKAGDTLSHIANYYGIPGRVNAIAAHNGIHPDRITVGQKIRIPGPLAWNIEPQDTLRTIAAYYGLDPAYLALLNGLSGPDAKILVGKTLVVVK
ncbi:LysM peptidoglycan-binding domain-containing protein [Arthrobacter sp. LAPM80]|uniref:LysM peptidoglycan-binding domain-containing protein n=1 Tax=Arthrobacter sp. LAPM80 TaxID=3141788 RepID=UPI00398AF538